MCYEEPILEVILFQTKDVITDSQTGNDWGDGYDPWA